MKKITFIGVGLNGGGGMERAITMVANYFSRSGIEVYILNLFRTDVYFKLENKVQIIWPKFERKSFNKYLYALMLLPYIRKNIKFIKPDAVVCFGEWFSPYVILATRFLGIRLFLSDRMGPAISMGLTMDIAKKITYRFADGFIAQTEAAKNIVQSKTGIKNIKVLHNLINFIEKKDLPVKQQIVTVGRLSKEKGHAVLLEAFASVKNKEWSLHIVGDGPEFGLLQNLSFELGIKESVVFHGHLKDFSIVLSESQIFVLPSYYEGFPNALAEAMSVPLACISTNCIAGPSEIIEHGVNGLLVKPGDINELSESIQLLITNAELRTILSQNAYNIRQTLDPAKIFLQYKKFIFP